MFEKKQLGEMIKILDAKFKGEETSKKIKRGFLAYVTVFRQSSHGEKKNNVIHRRD